MSFEIRLQKHYAFRLSLCLSLSPALGEETSYHIVSSLMKKLMFLTNSQQGVNPANSHMNEVGNDLVRSAKAWKEI